MSVCDILIVGGGVLGASAAYHLARRRPGRILLLESAYLGSGGSGQRVAHLGRGARLADHPDLSPLLERSLLAYQAFGETVGGPAVFTRTGLVLIAPESGDGAPPVPPLSPVSAVELLDLDPNAHLGDGERALLDGEAGPLDAVQVMASYGEAAFRRGVELRSGVEV